MEFFMSYNRHQNCLDKYVIFESSESSELIKLIFHILHLLLVFSIEIRKGSKGTGSN